MHKHSGRGFDRGHRSWKVKNHITIKIFTFRQYFNIVDIIEVRKKLTYSQYLKYWRDGLMKTTIFSLLIINIDRSKFPFKKIEVKGMQNRVSSRTRSEWRRNGNHWMIVSFCRWKYQRRLWRVERHQRNEQCPQRCTGNKNRRVRVDHCHLVTPSVPFDSIHAPRGPDVRSAAARLSSKLLRRKKTHKGRNIFVTGLNDASHSASFKFCRFNFYITRSWHDILLGQITNVSIYR